MADQSWSKRVADGLRRNDMRTFATVPDCIVTHVLEHLWADPACRVVTVTREEGVGLLAGAWLAGRRGALLSVKVAAGRAEGRLDRDVAGYARRFQRALAALPAR